MTITGNLGAAGNQNLARARARAVTRLNKTHIATVPKHYYLNPYANERPSEKTRDESDARVEPAEQTSALRLRVCACTRARARAHAARRLSVCSLAEEVAEDGREDANQSHSKE